MELNKICFVPRPLYFPYFQRALMCTGNFALRTLEKFLFCFSSSTSVEATGNKRKVN